MKTVSLKDANNTWEITGISKLLVDTFEKLDEGSLMDFAIEKMRELICTDTIAEKDFEAVQEAVDKVGFISVGEWFNYELRQKIGRRLKCCANCVFYSDKECLELHSPTGKFDGCGL